MADPNRRPDEQGCRVRVWEYSLFCVRYDKIEGMALCLQCSSERPFHDRTTGLANWLKDRKRESALPPNPPCPDIQRPPKNSTVNIKVRVGGDDRLVLFWAAQCRDLFVPIKNAPEAYARYANQGVAAVRDGVLSMDLRCPQPYREDGKVWPPHAHYVERRKTARGGFEWDASSVYAVAAYPGNYGDQYRMTCIKAAPSCCFMTPRRVRDNSTRLFLVSALPPKYRKILQGEKSLQIPWNTSQKQVELQSEAIGDDPYVVYCLDEHCDAAEKLIVKLIKAGHMNVYLMLSLIHI